MKLTKNVDPDKYGYSGYGIGFDAPSQFLWSDSEWGKNVIFGVNSSSKHADNRKKVILLIGEGPTDGLVDATITVEAKYSINFIKLAKAKPLVKYGQF